MNLISRKIALVFVVLLLAVPAFAGKRRAAAHPSNPSDTTNLRGTILDNTTNQPVVGATVTIQNLDNKSATTDAQGRYEIRRVPPGLYTVSISRTGYEPRTVNVTVNANGGIADAKLVPKPTVAVRMTNGSTVQLDTETIEFAYLVPFSGYARSEYARFCRNGADYNPDRSEIKRIIGPITPATETACCKDNTILRATVQLRTGETSDVFFTDSCPGYEVNLIGRDHNSGQFVYLKFPEISEVTFP